MIPFEDKVTDVENKATSISKVAERVIEELSNCSKYVLSLATMIDNCRICEAKIKLQEALTEVGVHMCAEIITLSEAMDKPIS